MHAITAQAKWTHMPRVGWSGTAGPGCCGSCGHSGQDNWDGGWVSIAGLLEPEPQRGTPSGQVAVDQPGNRHGCLRGTVPPAGRGKAGRSPRRGAGYGGPGSRAEGPGSRSRLSLSHRRRVARSRARHQPVRCITPQHQADGVAPAPLTRWPRRRISRITAATRDRSPPRTNTATRQRHNQTAMLAPWPFHAGPFRR